MSIDRPQIWYLFGIAAFALIALRWQVIGSNIKTKRWIDPIVLTFSGGLLLGAFGALSKLPPIASRLEALFPNGAWLAADILFLFGITLGTFWVDLMRRPEAASTLGWRIVLQFRTLALIGVVGWMIVASIIDLSIWATLERGGIDAGGRVAILMARMGYFLYTTFWLGYISFHFYQKRKSMIDRFHYIRLTIPFAAITLAAVAPVLQLTATIEVFLRPDLLTAIWPPLWGLVSVIQAAVAALIIISFTPPAYRTVAWLDKQLLIYRLQEIHTAAVLARPELRLKAFDYKLVANQPDEVLVRLINDLSDINYLIGGTEGRISAPAGRLMSAEARQALNAARTGWRDGLSRKDVPHRRPLVEGDTYALANWYAQMPVSKEVIK